MKHPKAPSNLSKEAQKEWARIHSEYEIEDRNGLLLLASALECFDRVREAQKAIKRDGLTVKDRFGQLRAHPAATVERDQRSLMLKALKALGLDLEETPIKKPGRPIGS